MMEAKSNASQAFSNGDFASALEEYTKALRLQPTSALTFSKRAECFVKLKRNKAAKQDCEQALKINPDSAKAMKVLGTAQRYLGEYEEACKNLGQGLAIDFDEESAKVEKEAEKFFHEIRVAKSKEKAKREQEEKKKMEERRKEAEEAMKNANMGGGNGGTPGGNPGGFPGAFPPGMEGLMNDPEVMEAMMNPKVMSVLQQAQSNPGALIAAMSDPEVGPLLQKIVGKMGGSMGGGGGGGGAPGFGNFSGGPGGGGFGGGQQPTSENRFTEEDAAPHRPATVDEVD
jgi:suppressor of tumorigenicity protein 13